MDGIIILKKANSYHISEIYKLLHRDYIKKYSEKTEKEEWKAHKQWYKFLINSPKCELFIVSNSKDVVLGQVKYELESDCAVVSIYLKEEARGKGYAKDLIKTSIEEMKVLHGEVRSISAYILDENKASIRVVESLGFVYRSEKSYCGTEHRFYVKDLY